MAMLKSIAAWLLFFGILIKYMVSRTGLCARPRFTDHTGLIRIVTGHLYGWKRLRVVAAAHCPPDNPVVFVSNHVRLDDPHMIWPAVNAASQGRIEIRFMMRDDFFRGFPWKWLPIRIDDIAEMAGAYRISRDNIQLSQVKPFLKILEAPGSFLMFPAGTRSRSGLLMEYRPGMEEPGGASFFVMHAQRRHPECRVAAVPLARTYNPVNRQTTVVFGPPAFLETQAGRETLRRFDYELVARIGGLVEIQAPHVVSGLLYLRCLHGLCAPVNLAALTAAARRVFDGLPHRHVAPDVKDDMEGAVRDTVRYLRRRGMLRVEGEMIVPNVPRILSAPQLDTRYGKRNPVKYLVNQVLHLPDVTALLEEMYRS